MSTTHATEQSGSTTPIDQPVSRPHSSSHGVSTNLDFENASKIPIETTTVNSVSTTVTSKPEVTVTMTTVALVTPANTETPIVDKIPNIESSKPDTTISAPTTASAGTTISPNNVESSLVEHENEVTTVSITTVTIPLSTVAVTEPSSDTKFEEKPSDENIKPEDTTITSSPVHTTTIATISETPSDSKPEETPNMLTNSESTTATSMNPPNVEDVDNSKPDSTTPSTPLISAVTTEAESKLDHHEDESTTTASVDPSKIDENKYVDNTISDITTPSTPLASTVTTEAEIKPDQHSIDSEPSVDATTAKPESDGTITESTPTRKPTEISTESSTESKVEDNNNIDKVESNNELTTIVSPITETASIEATSSTINNETDAPNSDANNHLKPNDQSELQQTTTAMPQTKPVASNEDDQSNLNPATEAQHLNAVSTSTETNDNMLSVTHSTSNIFEKIGNLCNKTTQESADKMESTAIVIDVTTRPNEMILSTIASTDKVTENQNNDNTVSATQSPSNIFDDIRNLCNKTEGSSEVQHKDQTTENVHENAVVTVMTVVTEKPETVSETVSEMSNPTKPSYANHVSANKENESVTSAIDETTTVDPENASTMYRSSISLVVPLFTVLLFFNNFH